MKLIDPSVKLETKLDGDAILKHIELAIRNCYKSEDKIAEGSDKRLIKTVLDSHHYSTIEHYSVTVRVICSRACLAQWTRHRLMSYSVESQRYCNYSKGKFKSEIVFIKPIEFDTLTTEQQFKYKIALEQAEKSYMELTASGLQAQLARGVLPNDAKTEMIVTANLRAWRDFFKLRTAPHAQIEIRTLAKTLLAEFKREIPIIYDDIGV